NLDSPTDRDVRRDYREAAHHVRRAPQAEGIQTCLHPVYAQPKEAVALQREPKHLRERIGSSPELGPCPPVHPGGLRVGDPGRPEAWVAGTYVFERRVEILALARGHSSMFPWRALRQTLTE